MLILTLQEKLMQETLKIWNIKFSITSVFSFIVFMGIFVSWAALKTSSTVTYER